MLIRHALGYTWDPAEPPFTADELDHARHIRQHENPAPGLKRRDRCPHAAMCHNVTECVEKIAWYLRYRKDLEA